MAVRGIWRVLTCLFFFLSSRLTLLFMLIIIITRQFTRLRLIRDLLLICPDLCICRLRLFTLHESPVVDSDSLSTCCSRYPKMTSRFVSLRGRGGKTPIGGTSLAANLPFAHVRYARRLKMICAGYPRGTARRRCSGRLQHPVNTRHPAKTTRPTRSYISTSSS